MKRNAIQGNSIWTFVLLDIDTVWVVRTYFMKRKKVKYNQSNQHDRQCYNM